MLKTLKHYYHEEHEDGGRKSISVPLRVLRDLRGEYLIFFNVPRHAGVGDNPNPGP